MAQTRILLQRGLHAQTENTKPAAASPPDSGLCFKCKSLSF